MAGVILAQEALIEVKIVAAAGKCLMLYVAIVEISARFLSDLRAINRFTAATVLRKWVDKTTDNLPIGQDLKIGNQVLIKIKTSLML